QTGSAANRFTAQPKSLIVTGRLRVRRPFPLLSLGQNQSFHSNIFIRNSGLNLRSCFEIANMFDGAFSLLHQILHPDGGARMNPGAAPPDPEHDLDQPLAGRDEAWEAWLASRERCEDDEPFEFAHE